MHKICTLTAGYIYTDENNMKIKMWTVLLTTIRKARKHCQDVVSGPLSVPRWDGPVAEK